MKNPLLVENDVSMAAAATNDIDGEKSIENNCQLHTGCGMENNNDFSVERAMTIFGGRTMGSDCAYIVNTLGEW